MNKKLGEGQHTTVYECTLKVSDKYDIDDKYSSDTSDKAVALVSNQLKRISTIRA